MRLALLAAAAAVLFSADALALGTGKLLIVYDRNPNVCVTDCTPEDAALADSIRRESQNAIKRGFANLSYLLDRFGVNHAVTDPTYVLTEEARIGRVTWNRGTAAATTEAFDAVLHFPFDASQPKTTGLTCRADSLWRALRHAGATAVANGQSVPAGFVFRPVNGGITSFQALSPGKTTPLFPSQATSAATRCSLGLIGHLDTGSEDGPPGAEPRLNQSAKTKRAWLSGANLSSVNMNQSTAGGIVGIVRSTYAPGRYLASARGGAQTLRPDSFPTATAVGLPAQAAYLSDTLGVVSVWERRYSTIANGSSVYGTPVNVCGLYWGAAMCSDTLTGGAGAGSTNPACEGAPEQLLFVVSRLDSLTGGKLFDRSKPPMVVAPVVYGGFSRATRRHFVGLNPADTTSLWGTLDSLAVEGIPLTVAANVDSIQTYASEIAQWKKVGNVKFVPFVRTGLDSAIAGNGNSSPTVQRDVWGRYRSRMIYGNAGTWGAANDTSLRALYRYAVDTLSRQVGHNFVLRTAAVAPDDDWSPKNAAGITNFVDSLVFTLNSLGITKLVVNAQVRDVDKVAPTARVGWIPSQALLKTSNPAGSLWLMGHTGFSISGGSIQDDYGADSTTWTQSTCCNGYSTAQVSHKNVNRWLAGILGPENYKDYDYFPYDGRSTSYAHYRYFNVNVSASDYLWPFRRAHVLRLCPNDLAGSAAVPVRPAYFSLKSLNNLFNALNGMTHGRYQLVRLGTLDEASP